MKASELRIGNWVNAFGIPRQVNAKEILSLYEIEEANQICIDLSYIPLTEEWLDKLGFKEMDTNENGGDHYFCHSKSDIGLDSSFQPYGIFGNTVRYDLEYVHQLQNLYYALVGQELTIKETD